MYLRDSKMQILKLLSRNREGLTLTQIHKELANKVAEPDILIDLGDLLSDKMVIAVPANSTKKDAPTLYCFNEASFKGGVAKKIIGQLMEME